MTEVIRVENPDAFDAHVRTDMNRWWFSAERLRWTPDGELLVWFDPPSNFKVWKGVERLASFGVRASVVRREVPA